MTRLFSLLIFLLLCSCATRYSIDHDKIEGNKAFREGFYVSEIIVESSNADGRPDKYSIISTVSCQPLNQLSGFYYDDVYNPSEKEILINAHKTVDSIFKLNGNIIGGSGHDKGIDLYISAMNKQDSLKKLHLKFKPQKKIFFKKPNSYYKWIYCIKQGNLENAYDYSKGVHNELPVLLENRHWYLFNFTNAANLINKIFCYVDDKGKINQYKYYYDPLLGI